MNKGNSERPKKNKVGSVEEILLLSLENRELYGLEIVEIIKQASEGKILIGIGSLYSTLHTLEKKGLVTSRWGDEQLEERLGARRRYYSLTISGKQNVIDSHKFRANLANWRSKQILAEASI